MPLPCFSHSSAQSRHAAARFCKAAAPSLERLVAENIGVSLIHKDWPILTNAFSTALAWP